MIRTVTVHVHSWIAPVPEWALHSERAIGRALMPLSRLGVVSLVWTTIRPLEERAAAR